MSTRSRCPLAALILAALALAGYRWGPDLYHNTIPQTDAFVRYAGGEWREVTLADGRSLRVVSVLGEDRGDILFVADVAPMAGPAYYAYAEAIALAEREAMLAQGTTKIEVMLMVGDRERWPWEPRQMRGYHWQQGGVPSTWKFVTYIGPVADRPAELTAPYAAARARNGA